MCQYISRVRRAKHGFTGLKTKVTGARFCKKNEKVQESQAMFNGFVRVRRAKHGFTRL